MQVLVHGECGEADIHPIEKCDEVTEDQERDETLADARDGPGLQLGGAH